MSSPPPTARVRWGSVAMAALLLLAALANFLANRAGRAPLAAWASEFVFDTRRPLETEALLREPYGSLAAVMASEMALADLTERIPLQELPPGLRRAWLDSVPRRSEALAAAALLVRSGLARRPGFGDLRLAAARLDAVGAGPGDSDRSWALRLSAARALPGIDAAWSLLAAAAMERWPQLSEAERDQGLAALTRAFQSPAFVRAALPAAIDLLGSTVLARVPEDPPALDAALHALASRRAVQSYAEVFARLEAAQRRSRASDLAKIEHDNLRGEREDVRQGCRNWVGAHRPLWLDSEEGVKQAARVLSVWPLGPEGSWSGTPKADLVRFLLNGREREVPGAVLVQALSSFPDVPEDVRERAALLAGSTDAVRRLLDEAPDDDPDWAPALLTLARREAAAGRPGMARRALEKVPAPLREGCEGLISEREVARRAGDAVSAESLGLRLAALLPEELAAEAWSADRSLGLCIDPDNVATQRLEIEIASPGEAFLEFGWNGGRRGTVRVSPGRGSVSIALAGVGGRGIFFLRDLAGGPTRIGRTRVVTGPLGQGPEPGQ